MFLKSLILSSNDHIIRDIRFHKGLNLIVDETPSTLGPETGNSVGKTTVLMLIDFCLGSDARHIYTDPENKKEEYKLVKNFLVENSVLITLVLKENLDQSDSKEIRIERNFLSRKQKVQRINDVAKTDDDFEETLTSMLFPGHYPKKPTFRQIISHNIRYKDISINNTLRILDNFTRDEEYETLYLFLFGFDFDSGDEKQELREKIRLEEKFKKRLEREETKSAYEAALGLLNGEIKSLEIKKNNFSINSDFESDIGKLNEVKYHINRISQEVTRLTLRRNLIQQAQRELKEGTSAVDVKQLELIYRQAKAQIDKIHKTFVELQKFHNQMIDEKLKYVTKELPKIEKEIAESSSKMKTYLKEEESLGARIARKDSFEELEKIIAELNGKYREKGKYENIIKNLVEVEGNLNKLNLQLNAIDDNLFSEKSEQIIKAQVDKFNRFFAEISKTLYGEKYALKVEPKTNSRGQRLYEFRSFNVNFSSGKKQGEISCFDIAYTLFADNENIPCMHFMLNDKKELMHDNQLVNIANLANERGIQFVSSILKDKLPGELNQEKYFVVKLSQNEKLFRIEKESWKNPC